MNEYPYFNPYAPYMPMQNSAYPPANQIQGVRFVSNRQEAESCAVPRGTKALLMDSNKDIFYLKETDMNGISTISEYSFKKVEPQLSNMYNDLSKQEYSHIQILHSHLLKVYESFGEQTDMVQNLFDWQNKKIIDGAAHVKTLIDMYK
jgi:hypothetical protein